jgi:molybdenum cofactor biosynthesis enzyme
MLRCLGAAVDFEVDEAAISVHCRAQVGTAGKTGVGMEVQMPTTWTAAL